MIQTDISGVWCNLSLPELLEAEQSVSDAHAALEDSPWQNLPMESADDSVRRIWELAKDIRDMSDVVLVVGGGADALGVRGIMQLLQGENRNCLVRRGGSAVYFVGQSLSPHRREELGKILEGKDFSLILLENEPDALEAEIVFRSLRWMLERKYGASVAQSRIFAVCREGSDLQTTAQEESWQCLTVENTYPRGFGVLSGRGLLPLCVAGVDIEALLNGAWQAKNDFDLRSYENPAWLYVGVGACLARKGGRAEVLSTDEPDMECFGRWWQSLRLNACGRSSGLLPIFDTCGGYSAAKQWLGREPSAGIVTSLCFDTQGGFEVVKDVHDARGLNFLAGVEGGEIRSRLRAASFETMSEHSVSVLNMTCGELNEKGVGELTYFWELSAAILAKIVGDNTLDDGRALEYRERFVGFFDTALSEI